MTIPEAADALSANEETDPEMTVLGDTIDKKSLRHTAAVVTRVAKSRIRTRLTAWHAWWAGRSTVPKGAGDEVAEQRREALRTLDALSREAGDIKGPFARVLVDGMWENANYWTRYALLRAAAGLSHAEEIGILGAFGQAAALEAFRTFGFSGHVSYDKLRRGAGKCRAQARRLLEGVRTPDDVLRIEFPYGMPAETVYDGLLKRQRRGEVDTDDPLLVDYIAEALQYLEAAHRIFEEKRYDLVVLSHSLNFEFGAIASCAIQAGIPVVVLYGTFGTCRFMRLTKRDDLLNFFNCPTPDEVASLDQEERERRVAAGELYLKARFRGVSGDLSAMYAFQRANIDVSRDEVVQSFGWDADKPIVCVFASNWFDFPHWCGVHSFRDFRDWIDETIAAAVKNDQVNWLFKPHPCDEWYGAANGPTVAKLVAEAGRSHIRVVDEAWNGYSLMQAIDAGVTYFGTIGMELPAIGKPALAVEEGWYVPHGFVVCRKTREGYLSALSEKWWEGFDRDAAARDAKEFIGWFYGSAEWHGAYRFRDDTEQYSIYRQVPDFLATNADAIRRDVELLREWITCDHPFYHPYKMLRSRVALDEISRQCLDVRDIQPTGSD